MEGQSGRSHNTESTTFSVAETGIGFGVAMEDTPYQIIRRVGDESPRFHGAPPKNMHKYLSLASNSLLLLHSFPGVSVGVATEVLKVKS